jgi:hypothetical protein
MADDIPEFGPVKADTAPPVVGNGWKPFDWGASDPCQRFRRNLLLSPRLLKPDEATAGAA